MTRCKTCKHWTPESANEGGSLLGGGECGKAPQIWDVTEFVDNEITRVLKPEHAAVLAVVEDGSAYRARLITMPDFGCVQHEPTNGAVPGDDPNHWSNQPRKCGVCGHGIPRDIDWPFWKDGKPAHSQCADSVSAHQNSCSNSSSNSKSGYDGVTTHPELGLGAASRRIEWTPEEARQGYAMRNGAKVYCCYGSYCEVGHSNDCAFGGSSGADGADRTSNATPEQRARDMLERAGVPNAQAMSAGDLVEIANLIAAGASGTPP